MSNSINYNFYMRKAMLDMVSGVLSQVAESGLPGEHHFYISFLTRAKGVSIPEHLLIDYPDEMTIVLQEWFDDLAVMGDERFAVTLSFHGKAEKLVVPFEALTGFSDPSVQFNLRFDAMRMEEDFSVDEDDDYALQFGEGEDDEGAALGEAQVIEFDKFRKK